MIVFLWRRGCVFVVVWLCFCGGVVVFCGGVAVLLCWCACVFVVVRLCSCGGVAVLLWWCGCFFGCGSVFVLL